MSGGRERQRRQGIGREVRNSFAVLLQRTVLEMEGQWAFSSRAFSWRSRDRNPKEKENKQTHGSFRKSFGKSWRFKRSNDNTASSSDSSDCPKSDSQRLSFSAAKPPCQAFGSTQSQVYPQENVSSLNKPGLLSSSAQEHGERRRVADERRRLSDVGAWAEKNEKFGEVPSGMYKRLHMLSLSARHPEMDYTFSNHNCHKASKDSIKGDLQMHDICLLEEHTKVDCTELQKHDTNVIKVTKDSGNTEASHNLHLASKQHDRSSFVSHPEASSQAVSKDGKRIACNSSEKSGNIKSSQKFVKASKHFLLSHSADEARSRAVALHRWFKHIIKRKGSQNLKSGEKEQHHSDDLDQSMCMNAKLENDILQQRILEGGHNSSGLHLMAASLVRKNQTNKAYFDVPDSLSQLLRSSSLPHSESYYVCRNIHADIPRRSEASAGNLRRFSIIGSDELEALESEEVLFPQRRHRESIHKKSVLSDKPATVPVHEMAKSVVNKFDSGANDIDYLNNFLKRQRTKLSNVPPAPGDDSARVKIILSGSDLSLSSMMAAIGYAWLLEHSATQQVWNPVPVINTTRQNMWEHREAAWLFYHAGLDARTLLFCDEVDLESLVHARQLSIVVIGQDALKTEDEVASPCTILVEEYKEHASELLQLPYIREILLAGILLDTQNLDSTAVYFTTRDRVAVDLLLVGCSQCYRYALFDELNQNHSDNSFEEAMRHIYGEPLSNSEIGKGDEEDECISQKFDTNSKDLMASSKMDVTGALQHEDGSSCSNANLFDDPVLHSETSLAKSDVSQASSLSVSGRNAKINWMVAKWFRFGSGSRQSVET